MAVAPLAHLVSHRLTVASRMVDTLVEIRHKMIPTSLWDQVPMGDYIVRRKAFTLIEVLVAMAIIALLVALVAGVASLSRRQAGEARAMSHLRQIHIATALYVEDKAGCV